MPRMNRIWKEVLCQGFQRDKFGRWFRVGKKEIGDAYRNARSMLKRKFPCPLIWEHINGIEAFWSFTKRRLTKFNGVKKHFALHLKECEWRYGQDLPTLKALLLNLIRKPQPKTSVC